jgi:hypothetical protein
MKLLPKKSTSKLAKTTPRSTAKTGNSLSHTVPKKLIENTIKQLSPTLIKLYEYDKAQENNLSKSSLGNKHHR